MSISVNLHTEDALTVTAGVKELPTSNIVMSISLGRGDHLDVFGNLEQLQRVVAELHVGLERIEKVREVAAFERSLAREHSVPCARGCGRSTFNHSAVCDECAAADASKVA